MGLYLTHSDVLAEEIVQEVFLRVWVNRQKLNDVIHFKAYLKTIARNVAYDYLRDIAAEKLATRNLLQQSEKNAPSVEHVVSFKEYEQLYEQAIRSLSPQRRKTYELSRKHGLKNEQIAQEMQISIYTVKENLKLASRHIRTQLSNRMDIIASVAVTIFLD